MVGVDIVCEYCGYVELWMFFSGSHDFNHTLPIGNKPIKQFDRHRRRINEQGYLLELNGHVQYDAPCEKQLDSITKFVYAINSKNVKYFKSKWNSNVTIIPNYSKKIWIFPNEKIHYILTETGFSNYYKYEIEKPNEYSIEITKKEFLELTIKFFEKFKLIKELDSVRKKLIGLLKRK